MSLKIGIITTSVREGRVGLDVANWVFNNIKQIKQNDVYYELVDLKNYDLPFYGVSSATENQKNNISKWSNKMAEFDGYIFVIAEYNHLMTGAIKNAMDYLKQQVTNKVASFVGYGAFGGSRAIESFRMMLGELQVACTQKTVNFMLAVDFENYSIFKPKNYHISGLKLLLEQNQKWAQALKTTR